MDATLELSQPPMAAIDLLTSLETRQDEVLTQLDLLNSKIEQTLQELGKLKVETPTSVQSLATGIP